MDPTKTYPNDLLLVMPHNAKVFRTFLKRAPPVGEQHKSLQENLHIKGPHLTQGDLGVNHNCHVLLSKDGHAPKSWGIENTNFREAQFNQNTFTTLGF